MKNTRQRLISMPLFLLLWTCEVAIAQVSNNTDVNLQFQNLDIRTIGSQQEFSTNRVYAIHQDKDGYIWFGTDLGLFRYDGFQTKCYKNDKKTPHMLTSNKITCIGDRDEVLWIGTEQGLNCLNRQTGQCGQYHFNDFTNSDYISEILITKNKDVWIGTEGGLYHYESLTDSFTLMCDQSGNSKVPHCAIKSLIEDSKGFIWIGTWDKGLFRYDPSKQEFYDMPKFNDVNSAQVVFEDSKHRFWVGTWGKGIYLIENPYDTQKPLRFTNYMTGNTNGGLISDYVYSMREDPYTGTLCIGTAKGLSFCIGQETDNSFMPIPTDKIPSPFAFSRGAAPMLCDQSGNIWFYISPAGVGVMSMRPRYFTYHALPQQLLEEDIINSLSYDHQGNVWIGLGRNGIICNERQTGKTIMISDIPAMRGRAIPQNVFSIYELKDERLLLATVRDGIIAISGDRMSRKEINAGNAAWLPDNCVYSFYEYPDGNILVGTWKGICLWNGDEEGTYISGDSLAVIEDAQVQHIMCDSEGTLWLSTKNKGIIRITGNMQKTESIRVKNYQALLNTDFRMTDIYKTLQDRHGRIWACSQETGLLLYDKEHDGFENINYKYGIPSDDICSMEEGEDGNLWLSSRTNIMCLSVKEDGSLDKLRYFPNDTNSEGTYYNVAASSSFNHREICFGCLASYTTFTDQHISPVSAEAKVNITDIRIFNTPFEQLPEKERNGISKVMPQYARQISLKQSQNDFYIFFSHFNYVNQQSNRFAYRLNGYDKDWIYPEAGVNYAYYCNLPAGTYTFLLKAATADGEWFEMEYPLTVSILPPPWLRWWAILIYVILGLAVISFVFLYLRSRELQRREVQLARLSKEKIEELNHKKLQFFTNITHDLMTPLTVISATMSELETELPGHKDMYKVIRNNLNKQMRLLQQILEFRKAETGNLKLRVSKGDIAEFCHREVESIRPLMNLKKLHLSLLCLPERIEGYFDTDALDKIVYNLLSNATKYTPEMGHVQVTLRQDKDEEGQEIVELSVEDNGIGISAEKQADLFKRFYDGEHRKLNTYGTGIGLSLTKDLVTLHHGTIRVQSLEGQGTTFVITIPITRQAFGEDEIDDDTPLYLVEDDSQETNNDNADGYENGNATGSKSDDKPYTLLLVEDNEELMVLMRNLLQRTYNILMAGNGKEALEIMEHEKVDLVVADVMMPVMDGIEMVKRLKSNGEYGNCPVIMLTAKRGEESRAEIYEAGADAFITKPFHIAVLQARIQNLLKRHEKTEKVIKDKLFEIFGDLNITNADEEFLKKCVSVVHKHLAEVDFDQQQFAEGVGASRSTLYKKLKSLTGLNTSAFIRSIRMKAACDIMEKSPSVRISDLAYAVGYNDPKYFSACFKKDFGILPSDYAKSKAEE